MSADQPFINSALSFVPPDEVLDGWATLLDDESWSAESLRLTYDEISTAIGVAVTNPAVSGKNNDLIVRGIEKLGWEGGLAPRSTPQCVGCGICYFGCPSKRKSQYESVLTSKGSTIQLYHSSGRKKWSISL